MKEGDSPSFLYFIPNGLNSRTHPNWGSWGGRYQKMRTNFYRDTTDTYFDVSVDSLVTNHKNTVSRWRPDFQADFAARVQWGNGSDDTRNHYPTINLLEQQGDAPFYLTILNGKSFELDASKSTDIDGDSLNYEWFVYNEVGSYSGDKSQLLSATNGAKTTLNLPKKGVGTFHIILKVTDNAKYPLSSYKRIVVESILNGN